MTIHFSDYEDDSAGSTPAGWNVRSESDNFGVVDSDKVPKDSHGLEFKDTQVGTSTVAAFDNPNQEDIHFSFKVFDAPEYFSGEKDSQGWGAFTVEGETPGGDITFAVGFGKDQYNDPNEPVSLWYTDDRDGSQVNAGLSKIGGEFYPDTLYEFKIIDIQTNLKIVIGGEVEYESGDSFGDFETVICRNDDIWTVVDNPDTGSEGVDQFSSGGGTVSPGDEVVMVRDDLAIHGLPEG